eukprot:1189272-Prorocentrum_minimum.AAC.2
MFVIVHIRQAICQAPHQEGESKRHTTQPDKIAAVGKCQTDSGMPGNSVLIHSDSQAPALIGSTHDRVGGYY